MINESDPGTKVVLVDHDGITGNGGDVIGEGDERFCELVGGPHSFSFQIV